MRRVALAALLLALVPGAARAADQTTHYLVDPQHTNGAPDSPVEPPLRMRWRADLGTPAGQVVVADGRVFYVREPGTGLQLTALDARDGHVLWSQETTYNQFLAYDAGRLYAIAEIHDHGDADGSDIRVRALDPASGSAIWTRDIDSEYGVGSYPTAAGGQLFFLASAPSTSLYGLRQSDGQNLWAPKLLSSGDDSAPAVDADSVYVSIAGHQTFAFNRQTGEQRWHSKGCCTGGGGTTPALHAGRLYAEDNLVHQTSDGLIVGAYEGYMTPTFSGDFGVELRGGGVRGFGPEYDTTRWTFDPSGWEPYVGGRPFIAGVHAYLSGSVTSNEGRDLIALRLGDGVPVWCVTPERPPGPSSSMSGAGSALPLAAGEGALFVALGYGLAAYENGGERSSCSSSQGGEPPPSLQTPPPVDPPAGPVSGPTLTMKVGRRNLLLGQRTQVVGRLSGLSSVRGQRVTIDLDDWPFDGRFRRGATARADGEGLVRFRVEPRRNVQVRLRLVSDAAVRSAPQAIFADFPVDIDRLGAGGPRPRLRVRIHAYPGARIRKEVLHAYLARPGERSWRRIASRHWQRFGRRSASVTFRYPRGTLGRRDRVIVCTREEVPDAFGRATPYDPLCGARRMPRGL